MTRLWARIRAKLARERLQPYGFRVVEPHHDGTPHWHLLLFAPPSYVERITAVIKNYWLADAPDERGAQRCRVKTKLIDPSLGSATS